MFFLDTNRSNSSQMCQTDVIYGVFAACKQRKPSTSLGTCGFLSMSHVSILVSILRKEVNSFVSDNRANIRRSPLERAFKCYVCKIWWHLVVRVHIARFECLPQT